MTRREETDSRRDNDRLLTRRGVLQRAGLAVAAAAFPSVTAAAMPQRGAAAPTQTAISDVMVRLSTYMSQAADRALPDAALEQTKWHVLDTVAAMVSGSELAPGRAAIKFARAYGGKEVATVVGERSPLLTAASGASKSLKTS